MLRKRVGTHRNEKNKNILRHEIQEKSRRNSKRRLGKGIKMNNNPWIWNCMQIKNEEKKQKEQKLTSQFKIFKLRISILNGRAKIEQM